MGREDFPVEYAKGGLASSSGPRELNEDSALAYGLSASERGGRFLFLGAVADGVGGQKGGETASRMAVDLLRDEFDRLRGAYVDRLELSASDLLYEVFSSVNSAIYGINLRDESLRGMGTTLTAFLAEAGHASVAHVGDSRAYLIRGSSIKQITDDHTLVEKMVRDKVITREQAAAHADRHVITRAIGLEESVAIDLLSFSISPGDIIMLCTDGLHDVVTPAEILAVLERSQDMQSACEELVRLAVNNGTTDNVTVLLWEVPQADKRTATAGLPAAERYEGAAARERSAGPPPFPAGTEGDSPRPPAEKQKLHGDVLTVAILVLATAAGFLLGWLLAAVLPL